MSMLWIHHVSIQNIFSDHENSYLELIEFKKLYSGNVHYIVRFSLNVIFILQHKCNWKVFAIENSRDRWFLCQTFYFASRNFLFFFRLCLFFFLPALYLVTTRGQIIPFWNTIKSRPLVSKIILLKLFNNIEFRISKYIFCDFWLLWADNISQNVTNSHKIICLLTAEQSNG